MKWIALFLWLTPVFLVINGCRDDSSTDAGSEPALPTLYVSSFDTESIGGAVVAIGSDVLIVGWRNYSTGEEGIAEIKQSDYCYNQQSIFYDCPFYWKAIIPLKDGANNIELWEGDLDGNYYSEIYGQMVFYSDNGPPEIKSHSGDISLGMSQWPTEAYVYFTELMDSASINAETFYVEDANGSRISGAPVVYPTGARLPVYGSPDQIYTARVTTGITDYWGTPIADEYSWNFEFSCGWAYYMNYPCP